MPTVKSISMRRPDDWHVHLRDEAMLKLVLPYTSRTFGRALVMPNLKEPVLDAAAANQYLARIVTALPEGGPSFTPVMTLKLTKDTTPEMVLAAAGVGVKALKLYPEGVTTNSEGTGLIYPGDVQDEVYAAMATNNMVLCVHGEVPGVFSLDREKSYLDEFMKFVKAHEQLKIVLEHVTTKDAVNAVRSGPSNLAATITAHHLLITLDGVIGDKCNVHNFCKPIAKREEDRDALRSVAFHGYDKFFLGTDSAPHDQSTKECPSACAGCFTAPMAIQALATLFDKNRYLERLEPFMSEYGAKFYGMPFNEDTITLHRREWQVPAGYSSNGSPFVVPFMSGQKLEWSLEE